MSRIPAPRVVALTCAALVGFAANSLLCRAALADGSIDAAAFTMVRLASGAVVLFLLARKRPQLGPAIDWAAPLALFAYAILFSFAYVRLRTGAGALLLFGAVQLTMIVAGIRAGERPRPPVWVGLALALAGLVMLTLPGAKAVAGDPLGSLLMVFAGVAWGVYSLRGRRAQGDPLRTTARNFALGAPLAVLVFAIHHEHMSARGVGFAVASGALASGVGYSLWYAVLPSLSATRAAIVQLSVPVIAALSGALLLGEPLTARLVLAEATVLSGVALAVLAR